MVLEISHGNQSYIEDCEVCCRPIQIQYKVFHYRAPPGEAGSDPDLQPILLQSEIVEVADIDISIAVRSGDPSPDQWNVRIRERP